MFREYLRHRCRHRFLLLPVRLALVSYIEVWVDSRKDRVLLEQACTEAVYCRYPAPLERGAQMGVLSKGCRELPSHVRGRFFGEGDCQDSLWVCARFHQP